MTERAVRIAGAIEQPRSLSPTSASAWQQCELKYALSYGYRWREPATVPALIGNTSHRSIELLYGLEPDRRTRETAGELLRSAIAEETTKPEVASLRASTEDLDRTVLAACEDALDGLFELEDPRTITVDPAGLEVWVSAYLYGAPVRGRIDRLYDASGAHVVADYKSGRVPRPAYTERAFFGLWTYAAALAASDPDRQLPDRIELLYLVGRERLARPVLRSVALEHAKQLARVWRQILDAFGARVVQARTSKLCGWCAFAAACPARVTDALPPIGTDDYAAVLISAGLGRRTGSMDAGSPERRDPAAEAVEAVDR